MKRIFITVYILLLGTLFFIPFSIGPIVEALFQDEMLKTEREFARGTFSLLAQRLIPLSPEDRSKELADLQPRFGYPLSLKYLADIRVAENFQREFLMGLIVEAEQADTLVMRLGQSDQALAMGGPWPDKELNTKVTVLFMMLLVVFLTLPALAWSIFLVRDMRKVQGTAARFAAGDHDARVKVSRISSMTRIADAFNAMAGKTQKLIASQKDLANAVSHEIRTPLARIKFSLEMAGDMNTGTAAHGGMDYMDEIRTDVEEIEGLVDEMLTYARFEREPEATGRLANHEMVSWLENLVARERKTAVGREIIFSPETDHFIGRFEPVYLGWAVRNLLRNGVRHSAGTVRLRFVSRPDVAIIHVDDDGPGIPRALRHKVFLPFFRPDKSRCRTSGGYGLGLAIAKRIINWHNGRISIKKSDLGGARFTLILPLGGDGTVQEASDCD
ncbi:MAG: hypothetical protein HUN04_07740 [Desulfobacter sp.]|nr:MAG: hypothetical protein HUN04_07740 [Desulfobacter sp.]